MHLQGELPERAKLVGELLEKGQQAGRQRRLRIKVPTVVLGLAMALIATIGGLGYFSSESSLTIWTVLLLCGIGMLLLSVLPTEKRLVKFVSFAVLVTLVTGARFIAGYTYEYAHFSQVRDDCGAPALEPGQSCWVHLLIVCAFGLSTAVWSLSVGWLLKVLWKRPSSRHLLDSLWQAVGFSYIAYALAQALADLLAAKDDEGNEWAADASGPSVLLFVLGLLGLYPSMRARLIAWLAIRGEASASAASLAQVMGAGKPADVIRTVQARLRCVPAHMLRLVDISSDVIPFDVAERTRPAQIGEIDAFVSHSWQADPVAKLMVLNQWSEEFRAVHGRWPLLWLDRYCVELDDAATLVTCLPVILASCNTLLVLYDDTFLSRLWCVVECFAFLSTAARYGGTVDVRYLPHSTVPLLGQPPLPPHGLKPPDQSKASAQLPHSALRMLLRSLCRLPSASSVVPLGPTTNDGSQSCEDAPRAAELGVMGAEGMEGQVVTAEAGTAAALVSHTMRPSTASATKRLFDVRNADCLVQSDKEHLLALIDAFPGGIELFNKQLPTVIANAFSSHSRQGRANSATLRLSAAAAP